MSTGHPANVAFVKAWREQHGIAARVDDGERVETPLDFALDWGLVKEAASLHAVDPYELARSVSTDEELEDMIYGGDEVPDEVEYDHDAISPLAGIAWSPWPLTEDRDFRVSDRLLTERAPMRTGCAKCGQYHDGNLITGRKWFGNHACESVAAA